MEKTHILHVLELWEFLTYIKCTLSALLLTRVWAASANIQMPQHSGLV